YLLVLSALQTADAHQQKQRNKGFHALELSN
ncbi:MAG: hypothetical protein RLZZ69_1177, partial [Cyanobacteriota bacterium]